MQKFKVVRYQGFTFGNRVADAFVMLTLPVEIKNHGLHALKNIANRMALMDSVGAVGINHVIYGGVK